MPYRRLRAAGHDPFVSTYSAVPLAASIASYPPHETPPRRLIDQVRDQQTPFETDNPEWAKIRLGWVLMHRLLGAPDGAPLRQQIADGEFGPEAASPQPPAGIGWDKCLLKCGWRADFTRCVCAGTAPDVCTKMALLDPPSLQLVEYEKKRLAAIAAGEAAAAARTGQPRPSLEPESATSLEAHVANDSTVPSETEVSVRVEAYSEPATNQEPARPAQVNRPQTLRAWPSRRLG